MIIWAVFGVLGLFIIFLFARQVSSGSIGQAARKAGFTGNDLLIAVAIAYAESGGNPEAVGDQNLAPTKGPSIGLWQINIGSAEHPEYSKAWLVDPNNNAQAAYALYQQAGNSFAPWTTYRAGTYQAYLGQATKELSA